MLVAEHIAALLVQAKVGTLGKTLFCHRLPAEIASAVVVMGALTGTEINHELPGWRMGNLQVIVRHPDYTQGMILARQVVAALSIEQSRDLPATAVAPAIRLRRLRPLHDPIVFPRSEGDVVEFSMNFEGVWVILGG